MHTIFIHITVQCIYACVCIYSWLKLYPCTYIDNILYKYGISCIQNYTCAYIHTSAYDTAPEKLYINIYLLTYVIYVDTVSKLWLIYYIFYIYNNIYRIIYYIIFKCIKFYTCKIICMHIDMHVYKHA